MAEAVVEYNYEAEQEDELTLHVGDVIKHVITAEGGWWEGELNGKKGMFPENFVRLKPKESLPKKEEKREATQRKSVRELANKFKDGMPMPGAQGSVMQKKKEVAKTKKCKVVFDYSPENDDELELAVGQVIDFLKEVEEGWWEGSLNGKVGVFPSNFVEMIEEGDGEQPGGGTAGDKDPDFQEIKGKKVMGVGLGNIFQGGPIKLRNTNKKPEPGKSGTSEKIQDSTSREAKLPAPNPPDVTKREKQSGERAVVRYSYTAEQPDELTLKEGEVIRVLDKHLEDEGWWRGEVNGKIGVFPDNFVEILPTQEEPSKAPKKPPPPVGKNIYPKLPDKASSFDDKPTSAKKDQARRKSGLTKRRSREEEGEEVGFDTLESSSHKLVHLTASRAKGPKKRPPSTVLFPSDVDRVGSPVDEVNRGNNHVQPEKPPPPVSISKEHKHISEDRAYRHPTSSHDSHIANTTRDSHESRNSHTSGPPPRPPEPSRHYESSTDSVGLARLVEELQREVRDIRAHSVSKNDYNDLRSDYLRLKQDFEVFKANHSKKLRELMMEVDDEKKLRLNTQVEMERVKKLLAETHV